MQDALIVHSPITYHIAILVYLIIGNDVNFLSRNYVNYGYDSETGKYQLIVFGDILFSFNY